MISFVKEMSNMTIVLGTAGLLLLIYLFWFLFKGDDL